MAKSRKYEKVIDNKGCVNYNKGIVNKINEREENTMKSAEEIRKEMLSSDTKEVAEILESLDENSIVLARTYMTALADRQQIEKTRQAKLVTVEI